MLSLIKYVLFVVKQDEGEEENVTLKEEEGARKENRDIH